jgi:hypothetical protein
MIERRPRLGDSLILIKNVSISHKQDAAGDGEWEASSMPGRGIQRQGREFNMALKKEMLILNLC